MSNEKHLLNNSNAISPNNDNKFNSTKNSDIKCSSHSNTNDDIELTISGNKEISIQNINVSSNKVEKVEILDDLHLDF